MNAGENLNEVRGRHRAGSTSRHRGGPHLLDSGASRSAWSISPKTKLGGRYARDADYSSLAVSGPTPTNLGERVEAFVEKFLTRAVYLRLYARQYRLISDGEVVLVPPEGGLVVAERNDRIREAGAELGYQFRTRVRAGVTVSYSDRQSTIETFGVEGLLAGFTLAAQPAAADLPLKP